MDFLKENWPRIGTVCAIILTPILFYYKSAMGFPLFLIWLQTPVYLLHQAEEYLIPGGFTEFFNKFIIGSKDGEGPLDSSRAFWVNVILIWILFPIVSGLTTYYDNLNIGMYLLYFSVANGLMHVRGAIMSRKYNPGLIVSFFLNVELGIYSILILQGTGNIWWPNHIFAAVVGILVNVYLVVSMKLKLKALRQAALRAAS
ncbi:MAG: HXXEE domain-containing protein [Candidatus Hodarchaeota archaeon]